MSVVSLRFLQRIYYQFTFPIIDICLIASACNISRRFYFSFFEMSWFFPDWTGLSLQLFHFLFFLFIYFFFLSASAFFNSKFHSKILAVDSDSLYKELLAFSRSLLFWVNILISFTHTQTYIYIYIHIYVCVCVYIIIINIIIIIIAVVVVVVWSIFACWIIARGNNIWQENPCDFPCDMFK